METFFEPPPLLAFRNLPLSVAEADIVRREWRAVIVLPRPLLMIPCNSPIAPWTCPVPAPVVWL
jgi:hypothetical protein